MIESAEEQAMRLAERYARRWRNVGASRLRGSASAWQLILAMTPELELLNRANTGDRSAWIALDLLVYSHAAQGEPFSEAMLKFLHLRVGRSVPQALGARNVDIPHRRLAVARAVKWIAQATGLPVFETGKAKPGRERLTVIKAVASEFSLSIKTVEADYRESLKSGAISRE